MDTLQAAKFFKCLSASVRLEIMRLLIRYGTDGLVAGQIAEELDLAANNLSFHLKELTHCQLIFVEQEGRFLRYRANLTLMQDLATFLTEQCCSAQKGDGCCSIK